MDKAGWQVASGLLAMALVGTGFALMATRGVLAQERNDRQACPTIEPDTVIVREQAQPVNVQSIEEIRSRRESLLREEAPKMVPPGYRCINGQAFRRIDNGWVQASIACPRDASQ